MCLSGSAKVGVYAHGSYNCVFYQKFDESCINSVSGQLCAIQLAIHNPSQKSKDKLRHVYSQNFRGHIAVTKSTYLNRQHQATSLRSGTLLDFLHDLSNLVRSLWRLELGEKRVSKVASGIKDIHKLASMKDDAMYLEIQRNEKDQRRINLRQCIFQRSGPRIPVYSISQSEE